jgi:hypothetical protein
MKEGGNLLMESFSKIKEGRAFREGGLDVLFRLSEVDRHH